MRNTIGIIGKPFFKRGIMNKNFKRTIKSAKRKLGISQAELADMLDVSPSSIGMYEQGRRTPNYDMLKKLCDTLKISVFDILSENRILNADTVLKSLIKCLSSSNNVILNGKVIDENKKDNVMYVLKLLLNDK